MSHLTIYKLISISMIDWLIDWIHIVKSTWKHIDFIFLTWWITWHGNLPDHMYEWFRFSKTFNRKPSQILPVRFEKSCAIVLPLSLSLSHSYRSDFTQNVILKMTVLNINSIKLCIWWQQFLQRIRKIAGLNRRDFAKIKASSSFHIVI